MKLLDCHFVPCCPGHLTDCQSSPRLNPSSRDLSPLTTQPTQHLLDFNSYSSRPESTSREHLASPLPFHSKLHLILKSVIVIPNNSSLCTPGFSCLLANFVSSLLFPSGFSFRNSQFCGEGQSGPFSRSPSLAPRTGCAQRSRLEAETEGPAGPGSF